MSSFSLVLSSPKRRYRKFKRHFGRIWGRKPFIEKRAFKVKRSIKICVWGKMYHCHFSPSSFTVFPVRPGPAIPTSVRRELTGDYPSPPVSFPPFFLPPGRRPP